MTTTSSTTRHRLPQWDRRSRRWWLYIGSHHGRDGRRTNKRFWWAASPAEDGTMPPPAIIAAVDERQNECRKIVADWPVLSRRFAAVMPDRDWTLPVWFDPALPAKIDAGGRAAMDQAMEEFADWNEERERRDAEQAAREFATNGLAALVAMLRVPFAPTPMNMPAAFQACIAERVETGRATALAELKPVVARVMVKNVTVREAIESYLSKYAARVRRQTSQAIEQSTSDAVTSCLRCAFGQSSDPSHPPMRTTPIAFDAPLSSIDHATMEAFCDYWHGKPSGVMWYAKRDGALLSRPAIIQSDRRVRNVLQAARQFFAWCADRPERDFAFPASSRAMMTAPDVKREAMPFDPESIGKIIAAGGQRVRMFALFGLCLGFHQSDVADTLDADLCRDGADLFVKRSRSKERKAKRGRRPIKVRHWIAPEFAAIIDAERGRNAVGTLFNSTDGTPLVAAAIGDRGTTRRSARASACRSASCGRSATTP